MNAITVRLRANGQQFVGRANGFDDSFFYNFPGGFFAASIVRQRLGLSNDTRVTFLFV